MQRQTIEPVEDPAVWTAHGIGGKEGLIHRIGEEHRAALAALRDVADARIGSEGPLAELAAAVRHKIQHEAGAVVVSGLDITGWSEQQFERVYWALGRELGSPVIQSGKGDLIGRVRHATDSKARGYLTDMELGPHTDYHELLSLACFSKSHKGGLSGLTSAIAVHNEMARDEPELLAELYQGYYNGIPFRYGVNDNEHGQRRVPAFSRVGDKVSAFTLSFWHDAAHARGEPLPERLAEAMKRMREIAGREDMQVRFMLEPGEMVFWNNRTVFHSRTRFENLPGQERLLFRLWLDSNEPRPTHPEITASTEMVGRFHELKLDQRESAAGY